MRKDAEDVLFLHDEEFLAVQLDLAAGVLAEEDPVALFHRERLVLALLGDPTGPHRDHLALLRLLLGGVGDDDAAVLLVALGEALDEHPVVERAQRRLDFLSHRGSLFSRCRELGWSGWSRRNCTTKIVHRYNLVLVYYYGHTDEDPDGPARRRAQPDPDPPATDGTSQARHRERRCSPGSDAAQHPGAGWLPPHQYEHGGARHRGAQAQRLPGGGAGGGGGSGPGAPRAPRAGPPPRGSRGVGGAGGRPRPHARA